MPEGPEVNVIKDGLKNLLQNKTITKIEIPDKSKFNKKTPDGLSDFKKDLPLKLLDVKSKGKFIYFVFEKKWMLLCRLLMSAGWYLDKAPKHNHLEMEYQGSNKKKDSIWFIDPRHFGTLKWTQKQSDLDLELNKIGKDLLNDNITEKEYFDTLRKKKYEKKTIASILMDQSIFSGVGNYLKSEILYQTKLSPHAIMKNIPDDKIKELYHNTLDRIQCSYKSGGASVRNYSDIKGKDGTFSFEFKVYQKKVDPLGNKVKTEKTKDGRTTHWVPELQLDYASSSN